jgi:hypothetical protein
MEKEEKPARANAWLRNSKLYRLIFIGYNRNKSIAGLYFLGGRINKIR